MEPTVLRDVTTGTFHWTLLRMPFMAVSYFKYIVDVVLSRFFCSAFRYLKACCFCQLTTRVCVLMQVH